MTVYDKVSRMLVLSLFVAMIPQVSSAYLDPGTGSYIFQVIIGVLLGGVFVLKAWWRQIVAFVSRLFSRKSRDDGSNN